MKTKIVATFIFLLTYSFVKSQTQDPIKAVEKKLKSVKAGSKLDAANSWLIDKNKDTIAFQKVQKGKWLLIDFWSTGCTSCIEDFPVIGKFRSMYQDRVEVIAVSVDAKFKRFLKSTRKYKIDAPTYFGGYTYSNAIFNMNVRKLVDKNGNIKFITQTPQYVLINPEGIIIDKNLPKPSSREFKKKIDTYLHKK